MRKLAVSGAALLLAVPVLASGPVPGAIAASDPTASALDIPKSDVVSIGYSGDEQSFLTTNTPFGTFPREGSDYLVLSTGKAADVIGGSPEEFISTDFGNGKGADGNDLTQVSLELKPPKDASCLAFDFQFLSEEYPDFVGSGYNDIFTAELNESYFHMEGSQVIAPNNFAYDSGDNFISINTVLGFQEATGTRMNGTTEPLVAISPIKKPLDETIKVFLTVQDIGDSIYDSAVIVDNFRWLFGPNCDRSVSSLTDSDGDGLPDVWETTGIDYNGDGTPEVDLAALGANPNRADIFVEFDWMVKDPTCVLWICWGGLDHAPQQAAIDRVVQAFANAPYENPDGSTGITLHAKKGKPVPWSDHILDETEGYADWRRFEALKQASFDPLNRDVYHYALFANQGSSGSGSSGQSRGIPAADFIVTDSRSQRGMGFSIREEQGTFMHELGHNLGLMHGGPDHFKYQESADFKSVMNYIYQFSGVGNNGAPDYSRSSPYADWEHIIFNGGSIGDLGESAPVLTTEIIEEMTPEDAEAVEGDGRISFEGPSIVNSGHTQQPFFVSVENPAKAKTSYTIAVRDSAGKQLGSKTVQVPGGETLLIDVPIDAASLVPGAHELSVEMTSETLNDLVASVQAKLNAVNLADSATLEEAQRALNEVKGTDHGMPGAVLDSIETLIQQAEAPQSDPSVKLSASNVQAGASVNVSAAHLPAGTEAEIWLHSEPVQLGKAAADQAGSFTRAVTIPQGTTAGKHKVVVKYADTELSADITITAAPGGSTPGTAGPEVTNDKPTEIGNSATTAKLSQSGTNGVEVPVLIGISILAVGAFILVLARKRRNSV